MDQTMLVAAAVVAVLATSGIAFCIAIRRVSRRVAALEAQLRAATSGVRDELAQVSAQGLRIATQLRTLERELDLLSDRQGRLELRGEGRPFEQAIVMLKGGATRAELVTRLGLSDNEAALLVRLHGARSAPAA